MKQIQRKTPIALAIGFAAVFLTATSAYSQGLKGTYWRTSGGDVMKVTNDAKAFKGRSITFERVEGSAGANDAANIFISKKNEAVLRLKKGFVFTSTAKGGRFSGNSFRWKNFSWSRDPSYQEPTPPPIDIPVVTDVVETITQTETPANITGDWYDGHGANIVISQNGNTGLAVVTSTINNWRGWNRADLTIEGDDVTANFNTGVTTKGRATKNFFQNVTSISWDNRSTWTKGHQQEESKPTVEQPPVEDEQVNIPNQPAPGRTIRFFCEGGYVAKFHVKWVNKNTFEAEEWSSGWISLGRRTSKELPESAVNPKISAEASTVFGSTWIFEDEKPDFNKEYKVYGPLWDTKWSTQ